MKLRMISALALAGGLFLLPTLTKAEPAVCSILSPAQVSSIIGAHVGAGIPITRSNPAAPGAVGHACAYSGQPRSAVLGLYHGSNAQLAKIKQINERGGSVTAMRGGLLVSALVVAARTPDRNAAKALLAAALSKL